MVNQQCSATIYTGPWSTASLCSKKATREFEGKMFCGIHHPESVAALQKRSDERWNEDLKIRKQQRLRAEAGDMAIELARWIVANRPENFGALGLELSAKARAVIDRLEGR